MSNSYNSFIPKKYNLPKKTRKKVIKGSLFTPKSISKTSFKGIGEDLFFAYQYLIDKYDFFYMPIGNFKKEFIMWDIVTSWKFVDNRFKLSLPKSLYEFIKDIQYIFKYKTKKFILLPLYLGYKNKEYGHFNLAIIDVYHKTFERFEPYGYSYNKKIHYQVNKKIIKIFKKAGIRITQIPINKNLPKISFQEIEEQEIKNSIASIKNSDPGGFCGAWIIFYAELVLKNKNIKRKSLTKKIIKSIKRRKTFRKFIRNYAGKLSDYRKKMLKNVSNECGLSLKAQDYENCTNEYIINFFDNKNMLE